MEELAHLDPEGQRGPLRAFMAPGGGVGPGNMSGALRGPDNACRDMFFFRRHRFRVLIPAYFDSAGGLEKRYD